MRVFFTPSYGQSLIPRLTILLISAVLFARAPAIAADAAAAKSRASTKQYHRTHGDIASVDTTAKTFTVKHGNDTSTFRIDDSTKYRGAGKEITFNDLQVGDDVRVSFIEDGTTKTAARVDVAHTKKSTDDPGPACKLGYHRCGHGDCCKESHTNDVGVACKSGYHRCDGGGCCPD